MKKHYYRISLNVNPTCSIVMPIEAESQHKADLIALANANILEDQASQHHPKLLHVYAKKVYIGTNY